MPFFVCMLGAYFRAIKQLSCKNQLVIELKSFKYGQRETEIIIPLLMLELRAVFWKIKQAVKTSLMSEKCTFKGPKSIIIFSIFSRAVIEVNLRLTNFN